MDEGSNVKNVVTEETIDELSRILNDALHAALQLPGATLPTIQKIIEKPEQVYHFFKQLISNNEANIITSDMSVKIKALDGSRRLSNVFPENRWILLNEKKKLLGDIPETVLGKVLFGNVEKQEGGTNVEKLFTYLDPNIEKFGLDQPSMPTPETIIDICRFTGSDFSFSNIINHGLEDILLTPAQIIEFSFNIFTELIPNNMPVFVMTKIDGEYYPLDITRDDMGVLSISLRKFYSDVFFSGSESCYTVYPRKK